MGDKIEYNDLFSPDAFSKAVEGINSIKVAFEGLSNEFKTILVEQKQFQEGFKVRSYDDIVKLNKSLAETEKTLKEFTAAQNAVKQSDIELAKLAQEKQKAQQQSIKTEIEYQKLQKISNAESKKKITLYQQESKTLNELRNKYKDLALSEKGASKEAQDLLAQITKLDAKLKNVDASVGQFQRNVGNYTGALDTFRTGVTNILGAAGIGVGLSEGISILKDSVNEFAKLEKSLKNLQAITGVSNKDLEFFSKNAEELGINVKGGAVAVVEAYKLIGSAKPELLENKDALNEVTKAAILLSQASGLELPQAATQLTQALNSFNAPAEDAGKFVNILSAASKLGAKEIPFVAEALSKFGGVAKSAGVSIEDSAAAIEILGAKIPQAETVGTNLRGIFIKLQTEAAKSGREFKGLGGELDLLAPRVNDIGYLTKTFGEQNLLAIQTLIQEKDALDGFSKGITDTNDALEQATINTDTFEQKQLRLENTIKSIKSTVGEYVVGELSNLIDSYDVLTGKTDAFELATRKLRASYKQQAEDLVKNNEAQKAQNFFLREQTRILKSDFTPEQKANALKLLKIQVDELRKALVKQNVATKEAKDPIDEETKAINTNTKAVAKNKEVRKESGDEREEENKKRKQAAEDANKFEQTRRNLDEESLDARKKLDEERAKAAEDEKKRREDELKDLFDTTSKALQIAEDEIKRKEKLRQDALDREIELRDSAIEEQKRRAEQGLSNTLAFEEKALKDAEARKEEENKKALKREKALTFFKLLSANAEKDPNSALQKTITEMLLGEAIAGAFFKGTEKVSEDLKGNKVHSGKDGYVVAVDGSERVLTGKQNELIGNMSNEDLARLANDYQNGLLPKYAITDSMSSMNTAEKLVSSAQLHQLVSLNKNIEDLKQTIINKKEVSLAIDNLGYIIREEIRNGLKTITKTPLTKGYGN